MQHIELKPVTSNTIHSVGYSPETKTLAIRFVSRAKTPKPPAVYHYPGIDPDFYQKLQEAESKGKFVLANVTKPELPFTKHELPQ